MSVWIKVKRKASTARCILKEDGLGGLVSTIYQQAVLHIRLWILRSKRSVEIGGCTFSLDGVPNSPMRLALLTGDYEEFELKGIHKYLNPNLPVVELGACMGVVSCITNRFLNHPSEHVVLEVNPLVLPLLERSRKTNLCQFEIVHGAIAYGQQAITFTPERDFRATSITRKTREEAVTVGVVSLGEMVAKRKFETFNLICDIEGHEYDLVMNESDVLRRAAIIVLETHARIIGKRKSDVLIERLKEIGFELLEEESFVVVLKHKSNELPS